MPSYKNKNPQRTKSGMAKYFCMGSVPYMPKNTMPMNKCATPKASHAGRPRRCRYATDNATDSNASKNT